MILLAFSSFALSFTASVALLVVLLLAAVGLSIFVYRHTVPDIGRGRRAMLIALRSAALAVLLFMIFEPAATKSLLRVWRYSPTIRAA